MICADFYMTGGGDINHYLADSFPLVAAKERINLNILTESIILPFMGTSHH